jgi:hypothetical protein
LLLSRHKKRPSEFDAEDALADGIEKREFD